MITSRLIAALLVEKLSEGNRMSDAVFILVIAFALIGSWNTGGYLCRKFWPRKDDEVNVRYTLGNGKRYEMTFKIGRNSSLINSLEMIRKEKASSN